MMHRTASGCCKKDIGSSKAHIPQQCDHGELLVYTKSLKRTQPLKRGRGFAASKAQYKKVNGLPCTVCGLDGYEAKIDPAHVYPRRLASCECAEGVVPLCRRCHRLYDDPQEHLDLLPALINRGYQAELVHAVVAHDAPLQELMKQVTGVRWEPAPSSDFPLSTHNERSS